MSSIDSLPPLHPPGRSKTRAAWSALLTLLLLVLLFFFHSFLLRMSVRSALWVLQPITGLTIKAEKMEIPWGKGIHWHQMTISAGKAPFVTQLTFQDCSIKFSSWWRLFFGDHLLITSWQASHGKGTIDLRTAAPKTSPFWKKTFPFIISSLNQKLDFLPASIELHDLSFQLLNEGERYTVNNFACTLPNKTAGQLSYESIVIEAGTVHCHLAAGKAKALWDGKKMILHQLSLANEILLHNLTIVPHHDRIELGIVAEAFDGLFRADGSIHHTPEGTFIDSALLGEQLPLRPLSHFLGLHKNLAGTIKEGRMTFRGFLLHPFDAEASLRMLAENVRLEKRGWASLSINANLIGRKISLADFQIKQHENRVAASGEMTIPKEWHKITQAPFLLKLKANISDASQLADLIGSSWKNMTGKLFADGEIHGAAHCAEGYLNIQGTAMTAYGLPLNSLKLQLLFQKEKTNLAHLDIWSRSDHLECSGVVENTWPHHYEGKAAIKSSAFSEKLIPLLQLLQQRYAELPTSLIELSSPSFVSVTKSLLSGNLICKGTLQLQGDNQKGTLSGNVTLQEMEGPSAIRVTPFLIPPGINIEPPSLSSQNRTPPWSIDVSITTPPERTSSPAPKSQLKAVNLHLLGDLVSPTLEGSILLQHVPIIFPTTTMSLVQGGWNFEASKPWQPLLQLTASGHLHGKKIKAILSPDHTLQLQSNSWDAPTTLALELASCNSLSPEDQESWFSQLPYWVREQSITEPTTLFQPVDPNSCRDELGFGGCCISYQAEMK